MNKSQPSIPKDFRGLRWEPSNEQEVVLLFGLLIPYLPRPLAIEFIQTPFPDCKATDVQRNEPIWIEFKLYSADYLRAYKKRSEHCDWIVCWHDDFKGSRKDVPQIVALDEILDNRAKGKCYVLNRRPVGISQEQYFRSRICDLSEIHRTVITELISFADKAKLHIEWPKTNGACFVVRGKVDGTNVEYFRVDAKGRIGTPFSRWRGKKRCVSPETAEHIVRQLNEAIGKQLFTKVRNKNFGKLSFDIPYMFSETDSLSRCLGVWARAANLQAH